MKSSISLMLLVICTVVLAAKESQAKKGCNAYGHACYGGHGKRSLGGLVNGNGATGNVGLGVGNEQDDLRVETMLQMLPNDILNENEMETYPRYRLIKIMKSWLAGHSPQRRPAERMGELDYPVSSETIFNRDNNNIFQ